MNIRNRPFAYWVILSFLLISFVLLLLGQTTAIINYDLAVQLGLQEDIKEIGPFGVQMNRAFGAADTIIYLPLIVISIIGVMLRKQWSLFTTAAVMGISAYWATTLFIMLVFLEGVSGYSLEPGFEYWLFMVPFIVFGIWGLFYLVFHGDDLLRPLHETGDE